MTFAFLEMLVQAQVQINNNQYRIDRGDMTLPRRIRRMVVTCPTAMSKLEREALVKCANDAVKLLNLLRMKITELILHQLLQHLRMPKANGITMRQLARN